MKTFASWFVGKSSEEDKQKLQIFSDGSKSYKKRYSALSQLIKQYSTQSPEKFYEFMKPIHQPALEVCINFLRLDNTRTKGKTAWDEVSSVLRSLLELTKYPPIPQIESLPEIATACLNEGNRWELREIGFSLVLNLLNNNITAEVPRILFLSAMDFSQISQEESKSQLYFMNRTSITSSINNPDLVWVNLVKTPEIVQVPLSSKYLADLDKLQISRGAKECLFFLSKTLEFLCSGEGAGKVEHFVRWFKKLKGDILYLMYPSLCEPGPGIGDDFGFRYGLPPILHNIVIKLLVSIIKTGELNPVLLDGGKETEFIVNVIGQSFILTESYNSTCYETVSFVIKLYQDWIMYNFVNEDIKEYWQNIMQKLLEFSIHLFDFSQDTGPRRISLCKEFLKMLVDCKDNKDRSLILNCALQLGNKTLETQDPNRSSQDIIEMVAEFLICTLAYNYESEYIQWNNFVGIIKSWSDKSENIIKIWLERMKLITSEMKELKFQKSVKLDGWLAMLKLLGNPLEFQEKVQVKWVYALQEIINLILTPAHTSQSPNLILEFFFLTLSKMIRQGAKESQKVSLVTLVNIFVMSRSEELPMQCYLQQLSLLIYLSMEKEYLQSTVLEVSSRVMDYPGMHFLLFSLLKVAKSFKSSSQKLLFYIMCLPNYYGSTKLENTEDLNLAYIDLKPTIQDLLITSIEEEKAITIAGLYGLSVFILEELESGNNQISELIFNVIQPKCLHESEEISVTAFQCLQNLSSSFPGLNKSILNFLINKCLVEIPNNKEKVLKSVLCTIQNWLLANNTAPCENELLSSLFKALSTKLQTIDSSSPLESEITTLVSFISIYYMNFPFKNHDSSVFHSIISDADFAENPNIKPLHYSLGSSVIFTMIPNAEKAKFILRNQFGRFCWEAYDFMVFEPATNSEQIDKALEFMQSARIELTVKEPPPQLQDEPLLPKLLEYIKENYPECYVPEKPVEASSEILKMIDSVEKMENECSYEEKKPEREKYAFNMGRFFIANFGLIDKLVQLQVDERFERGLGIIDNLKPRESVKIGVIYVAPGQQDEREILMNSGGSQEFQDFLHCLGEVIDIREHQGNLGGLDPSGSAGNLTISYADWQFDVIFHIVPLMPTDPTDEQQVQKKRHVGNDIVHIVWSDHWRDYRQDTMLTHFNFIIIVIYPLMKGLFRIQILKKIQVECGPLQDGMVISAALLPSLVRQTAIFAHQQVRYEKHHNYEKQTQTRKKQIQELIQRFPAQQIPKHQVYAAMF